MTGLENLLRCDFGEGRLTGHVRRGAFVDDSLFHVQQKCVVYNMSEQHVVLSFCSLSKIELSFGKSYCRGSS